MKKVLKYVVAISVLFNVYYLIAWVYSYNKNSTHQLRVEGFSSFFPPVSNPITITVSAILLSLISVIVLLGVKEFNKSWRPVILVIQIIFGLFYIWQLL
jgi:uncharacterized membrane protein